MTLLKQACLGAQQRCRMLLQQPASVEATLQIGVWWLDSRLCTLSRWRFGGTGKCSECSGAHLAHALRVGMGHAYHVPAYGAPTTGEARGRLGFDAGARSWGRQLAWHSG